MPIGLLVGLLAWQAGCTNTRQGGVSDGQERGLFRADIEQVVVEVDAVPDAPVRFFRLPSGMRPWEITRVNLRHIFGPELREVRVPERWDDVGGIETDLRIFTPDDLVALSERHRQASTPEELRFHVMFLRGTFVDEHGNLRPEVKGAHVEGTHVVAFFFRGRPEGAPDFAAVTQQLAVLHELGHAMGLVDLDTPSVRDHGIPEEPEHCRVPECVMHGKEALPVRRARLLGPERPSQDALIVFGPACLEDLAARRKHERGLR